jgi:hypothetical protein
MHAGRTLRLVKSQDVAPVPALEGCAANAGCPVTRNAGTRCSSTMGPVDVLKFWCPACWEREFSGGK